MTHIGIIGGGFSGTLTAVNLSRLSGAPLKITIINTGYTLGRGVAYSTRNGNHLLNVAARNMSALADRPTHFVEWLQTRIEYSDEPVARLREKFAPRRVYGDYLRGLLLSQSCWAADKGSVIETVEGESTDVIPTEEGARIVLSNGEEIEVNKVVLATGNSAPGQLTFKGLDPAHPRCFQNPWTNWEEKLIDKSENVILIGTGLTAIDAFLSLKDLGLKGKIFAISRNGLTPLAHFKGVEYPDWLEAGAEKIALSKAFRLFKKYFREARAQGVNPAILVDKLRPVTQHLWQNFSLAEKKRFNRHFRTRWNVARHRIAQSIHQQLLESVAARKLEIIKGRLCDVRESGDQLVVKVKTRDAVRSIEGGALINCTGPSETFSHSKSVLYRNLLARGLIVPDEMDMGIQITPDFAVVHNDGNGSRFLFGLGAMLKGSLWESSAVPELRSQTFRVAEILTRQLHGRPAIKLAEAAQIVHEYEYEI